MTKQDSLQRFIFENVPVRGEYVHLQESLQAILKQHPYPPEVRRLLAEALCAAALLSAVIKFEGRLSIQFRGKGGLKLLLAQCNNHFQMRGLAKYDENLSYEDLLASFNDGVLVIILDSGPKHRRYEGVVAWRGHSLAESIEGYFRDSEQLSTRIWLVSDQYTAAGFLLQAMPGEDQTAHDEHSGVMAETHIDTDELLSLDVVSILKKHYGEHDIRLFNSSDVMFKCTCSRESGENAIAVIGREEAEEELKDKNTIVVTCDFCNTEYFFDRVDVATIFESKDKLPPNTNLH